MIKAPIKFWIWLVAWVGTSAIIWIKWDQWALQPLYVFNGGTTISHGFAATVGIAIVFAWALGKGK